MTSAALWLLAVFGTWLLAQVFDRYFAGLARPVAHGIARLTARFVQPDLRVRFLAEALADIDSPDASDGGLIGALAALVEIASLRNSAEVWRRVQPVPETGKGRRIPIGTAVDDNYLSAVMNYVLRERARKLLSLDLIGVDHVTLSRTVGSPDLVLTYVNPSDKQMHKLTVEAKLLGPDFFAAGEWIAGLAAAMFVVANPLQMARCAP